MRRRVLVLLTTTLGLLSLLGAPIAHGAEVHGDDERDVFVGTGGLILPPSVDHGVRREVAGCAGCAWRLTSVCVDPGLGSGFDGQGVCGSVVRSCPQGRRTLRAWFRPAGGPWRQIDLVCLRQPVTIRQVGRRVGDQVEEGIPPLTPRFAPAQGAVTQIPVRFESGQPAAVRRWRMPIAGRPVDVEATPTWQWSFEDGPGSGGTGPVAWHAYGRPGSHAVTVVTTWSATFVVDGLGPFPVPEPITQQQQFQIVIGQGRAVLVPTHSGERARLVAQ